ncbi:hypothetical protein [Nocardia sp. NPDC020380]|uniref:hypothetical protein n=1 Tax=Nocardia sp. NPDC020380 TaxID=3364309 RepID=UPI0037B3C3FA
MRIRKPFTTAQASDRDQLIRMFAIFIGTGYLIYFLLLYWQFRSEARHLDSWWTPVALVLVFGPAVGMLVAAFLAELRVLERMSAVTALGYFLAVNSWLPAWTGSRLEQSPWLSNMPGLPAMAIALYCSPKVTIGYTFVVVTEVQLLGQARKSDVVEPFLPSWTFATSFCLVFVAATLVAVRTGRWLDSARAAAARIGARVDAMLARKLERDRYGDFIHNVVLAALRSAAVGHASAADKAARSLANFAAIGDCADDEPYRAAAVLGYLRDELAAIDDPELRSVDIEFVDSGTRFDAELVRTFGVGLGQAMDNSMRHAGSGVERRVTIRIGPGRLVVTVADNGSGFDKVMINRRWGLQRLDSQFDQIPGAVLGIATHRGYGTTIEMAWTEP